MIVIESLTKNYLIHRILIHQELRLKNRSRSSFNARFILALSSQTIGHNHPQKYGQNVEFLEDCSGLRMPDGTQTIIHWRSNYPDPRSPLRLTDQSIQKETIALFSKLSVKAILQAYTDAHIPLPSVIMPAPVRGLRRTMESIFRQSSRA